MPPGVLFLIVCVFFNKAVTEDTPPVTIIIQSSNAPNTRWCDLIPALHKIKETTTNKNETLQNIVKTIKKLLPDGTQKQQNKDICNPKENIYEDYNDLIKDLNNENGVKIISLGTASENVNAMKNASEGRHYTINRDEILKDISVNKTKNLNNILNKMQTAVSNVKKNNLKEVIPEMITILKSNSKANGLEEIHNTVNANEDVSKRQLNSDANTLEFTIPCRRASDILNETPYIPVPKEACCTAPVEKASDILEETPNFSVTEAAFSDLDSLRFIAEKIKSILKKLPPGNIVPNSLSCKDSGDTIAMLFKPKTITLMQVYGNLLRKIAITVLVPYHISKFISER